MENVMEDDQNKNEKKIVAIIQGRMGSSRLPGKVLKDISGKPMLAHVVERARRSNLVDHVIVATTTDESDRPIADFCKANGVTCVRGNIYDVLDRYYQAATAVEADIIVRLTADCPMIDPDIIDQVIQLFLDRDLDFAANRLPPPWKRTFPIGLDVEVCSFNALEQAWNEAIEKHEREHVMPYLYDVPGRFEIEVLNTEPDYGRYRWTVDTPEDLELARKVFEHFDGHNDFTYDQLIKLFEDHAELTWVNEDVRHKSFVDVDERFSTQEHD
jgi:spore coat polysaccharide biosynthesis protein SpsF